MDKPLRIIISGGGTGGHIFPAVSIANAIMAKHPDAQILFVGALGRMEMQRVPQAGYQIKGLPVRGLARPLYSPKILASSSTTSEANVWQRRSCARLSRRWLWA